MSPLGPAAPPEHLAQVADDQDGRDAEGGYEGCVGAPGEEVGPCWAKTSAPTEEATINVLTIVATVFLPLSFLTGYFGINFRILTADVQTTLWQFILLGLLLLIGSAAMSLLLIRRLEQRLGIRNMWQSPS